MQFKFEAESIRMIKVTQQFSGEATLCGCSCWLAYLPYPYLALL